MLCVAEVVSREMKPTESVSDQERSTFMLSLFTALRIIWIGEDIQSGRENYTLRSNSAGLVGSSHRHKAIY